MRQSWTVVALLALSLAACGRHTPPPAAESAKGPAAAQSAPNSELQQAIQQPLDKAKAVEGQLQQDKEALDAAVRDQGG